MVVRPFSATVLAQSNALARPGGRPIPSFITPAEVQKLQRLQRYSTRGNTVREHTFARFQGFRGFQRREQPAFAATQRLCLRGRYLCDLCNLCTFVSEALDRRPPVFAFRATPFAV